MASTCGMTTAPATPCAIRATTSVVGEGASPQAADAAGNSARPTAYTRRGPSPHTNRAGGDAAPEPAGGDEKRGEGQPVARDDPLERALAGAELGGDRRQRDVDDE